MKHPKVNVTKLVERMKKAVGTTKPTDLAKKTNLDVTRISRFLNGDFKKVTPVLTKFCKSLGVQWNDLLDFPPTALSPELVASLRRIVGADPNRIRVTTRLIRTLEVLATRPGQARKTANRKD